MGVHVSIWVYKYITSLSPLLKKFCVLLSGAGPRTVIEGCIFIYLCSALGFLGYTSSSRAEMHHGRLLMSVDSLSQPSNWPSLSLVLCLLFRAIAASVIFLKLFVFGEPSLQPDSKIAAKYWAFKRRADLTLEKVRILPST